MNLTGSHINYYFICKRKLWLFAHSIQMEQENENVKIGKLISETSYERKKHEIGMSHEVSGQASELENLGIKVDFYDRKTNTIHEIKKTNSFQEAHIWQVLFYIYVLKQNGIENVKGEIDYPKMKKKLDVFLTPEKEKELAAVLEKIRNIIEKDKPMTVAEANVKLSVCKKCSYFDLCYS